MVSRGYAQNYLHYSRESGVFVLAVEKTFSYRVDWHQDERAQPLVGQYQLALDSVLKAHPDLQPCVVHCAHCGIRFLTHPRNAGRRNLRCPFGCRRHHSRRSSGRRSTAYYQTAEGKRKKQALNRRRRGAQDQARPEGQPEISPTGPLGTDVLPTDVLPTGGAATEPLGPESPAELRLAGVVLDESSLRSSPVMPYLRMLVSLIEGVVFSSQELVALLRRALRQHSIVSRSRRDYVLSYLRQHPP